MKRNLLVLGGLIAALFLGDQILSYIEKNYTQRQVHFVFEMPDELPKKIAYRFGAPLKVTAEKVYVVGSFNDWGQGLGSFPGYEMRMAGKGKWELDVLLSGGRHWYKFKFIPANTIITKAQAPGEKGFIWIHDLKAKRNEDDGFDGFNSVIDVHFSAEIIQKLRIVWNWILGGTVIILFIGLATKSLFSLSMSLRWKMFSLLVLEFTILSLFFLCMTFRSLESSFRTFDTVLVNNILLYHGDQLRRALSGAKGMIPLWESYQPSLFELAIEHPPKWVEFSFHGFTLFNDSGHMLFHSKYSEGLLGEARDKQYVLWKTLRIIDISNVQDVTYGFFKSSSTSLNESNLIWPDPFSFGFRRDRDSYFVPLSKFGYIERVKFTFHLILATKGIWGGRIRLFPFQWFVVPVNIDNMKGYLLCRYIAGSGKRLVIIDQIIGSYVILFIFSLGVITISSLKASQVIVNPIHSLANEMGKVSQGNLTTSAMVTTKDEIQKLGDSFNDMVRGLRERELIKVAFGRYVSKQVAEKILKEPEKLEMVGERREVSIIFADIRDFTPYSETHTPEEVVQTLNQYFSRMIDVIFKYEGTLDKFIGDCVMAVFGAPLDQPDHAERAVRCAWEMQKVLAEFNREREGKKEPPIKIGIGVNSGEAVSGNVGSEKRTEFSVVGDSVNLASRLEDLAKEGQILIGPGTYEKVKGIVDTKALSPQTVKGKAEPVQLFEVTALLEPVDIEGKSK